MGNLISRRITNSSIYSYKLTNQCHAKEFDAGQQYRSSREAQQEETYGQEKGMTHCYARKGNHYHVDLTDL